MRQKAIMIEQYTSTDDILDCFRAYAACMVRVKLDGIGESHQFRMERYWYNEEPGFGDFNKEICSPGVLENLPEGGVGIRSDGDFWTEGMFPLEFSGLSIQQIVSVLWPHIENPEFGPDVYAE